MTTNTKLAMDQCARCTVRGDMDACRATPCNVRTSWFTQEAEATHLRELAAYRLTVENLEREIAAQQPAPSAAAAEQQAGATKEHLRLVRVIADKIEDGTLFQSGIYSNKDLARFVRNVADAAAHQPSPMPQADSQPAPVRDVEREAFKAAHRHLELDEVPDAWGRPMFKHSHVEASWLGWIARAASAPAGGEVARLRAALVYTAYALHATPQYMLAEGIALIDGDTVRVSRDGWTVEASVNSARATPPAQAADSVQEDAARLDWLDQNIFRRELDEWDSKAGGRGNQNMWVLFAPKGVQGSARKIIDAARKQGEKQ